MKRVLGRSGIEVSALGMGCWAIGGPFWADETPLGWGEVDDDEFDPGHSCRPGLRGEFLRYGQCLWCRSQRTGARPRSGEPPLSGDHCHEIQRRF